MAIRVPECGQLENGLWWGLLASMENRWGICATLPGGKRKEGVA